QIANRNQANRSTTTRTKAAMDQDSSSDEESIQIIDSDEAIRVPDTVKGCIEASKLAVADYSKYASGIKEEGIISVAIIALIAVFPRLHGMFEKYQQGEKSPGRAWHGTKDQNEALHIQGGDMKITKAVLALLYCLVKKPTAHPTEQINKRFGAAYVMIKGPGAVPAGVDIPPALDILKAVAWLSSQSLDTQVISVVLSMKKLNKTQDAIVQQVRLVASEAEMTSFKSIEEYLTSPPNASALLPGVGREIAEYVSLRDRLKERHKDQYPMIKLLRLPGHDELVASKFPNLVAVANENKRNRDPTFVNFKERNSSRHTTTEIRDAMRRPLKRTHTCGDEDLQAVVKCFKISEEEAKTSEQPVQDKLTALLERLTKSLPGQGPSSS
ncbi:nucleoprotein, partial [Wuhan sharpbelly bornavirus]